MGERNVESGREPSGNAIKWMWAAEAALQRIIALYGGALDPYRHIREPRGLGTSAPANTLPVPAVPAHAETLSQGNFASTGKTPTLSP